MTEPLSAEALSAFASMVETGVSPLGSVRPQDSSPAPVSAFRFYEPLSSAADEYEAWASDVGSRIFTGIKELDDAMRGTAPGELTLITASAHAGKTLLATAIVQNNAHRRLVLFTPDETRTLVLVKMVSLMHGVGAEDLERRLQAEDEEARRILRATASDLLPTFAVCDTPLTPQHMSIYIRECADAWGGPVEGVLFDYAELLIGAGEDVPSKMSALKSWGKAEGVPLFVLHQSSRSKGADGAKVTMTSGAYGGEQQATHLIGVRRKKYELQAKQAELHEKLAGAASEGKRGYYEDMLSEVEYDLQKHEHTVTFSLVKNKRPPCRLVDDLDFELEASTGRILPLRKGDLPSAYLRSSREALAQREMF